MAKTFPTTAATAGGRGSLRTLFVPTLLVPTLAAALALLPLAAPVSAQDKYRLEGKDWAKEAAADPASAAGQLQAIRRTLAKGDADEAKDMADDWIKRFPNQPLLVQAYLVRGDSWVAMGNEYKALFDYEQVIRGYPSTDEFNIALEREFEIARLYSAGRKRKFAGMRILPAEGEAEEIFVRTQERSPGSELGEKASMALGDHYFNHGSMPSAAEAYDLFLVNYPRSASRERAMLRAIQANLATFKGPSFDPTGLIEAGERIKQFQREFPAAAERLGGDAILVRIDESLGVKDYDRAQWYIERGHRNAGAVLFRRVIRDHPQTTAARLAMERLVKLDLPLAGPETVATTRPAAKRTSDLVVPNTGRPPASAPAASPSPAAAPEAKP
ncbi:MAG: outer membrane protein assembly factor BamD [Planctomycetota bacterium]|nr:outer membrane protein assembly factor BamD [Planctomycetota bacterium]